jgi:hypothetical protein
MVGAAGHREWVDGVVGQFGSVICDRYDPARQPAMRSNARAWLRWNPGDEDLRWLLDHHRDGIHRQDLRALSGDLDTAAERRRAFIATLLWGAGTTNRYYGRHSHALAFGGLDEMLDQSLKSVQRGDLSGGWSAMYDLPGLGFRFFTKWLWVTGIDSELQTAPLVFDQRVINGLGKTGWPAHLGQINYKQRWLNYCSDAAAVGEQLGVSGEWVEYWLFAGAPAA